MSNVNLLLALTHQASMQRTSVVQKTVEANICVLLAERHFGLLSNIIGYGL